MGRYYEKFGEQQIMDITEKINTYTNSIITEDSVDINKYLLIEGVELAAVIAALEKTMAEMEKNKRMAADIFMNFKDLEKKLKDIVNKPIMAREKKELEMILKAVLKM
jgi:hypothetical protein